MKLLKTLDGICPCCGKDGMLIMLTNRNPMHYDKDSACLACGARFEYRVEITVTKWKPMFDNEAGGFQSAA